MKQVKLPNMTIEIKESYSDYSTRVWLCAEALSWYFCLNSHLVFGKRVLELGAGVGLCSLCIEKLKGYALPTDKETLPWGSKEHVLDLHFKPDLIIGSDVLYDAKLFDDFFKTLHLLMERNVDVYIAFEQRNPSHTLVPYLHHYNLTCTSLHAEKMNKKFRGIYILLIKSIFDVRNNV